MPCIRRLNRSEVSTGLIRAAGKEAIPLAEPMTLHSHECTGEDLPSLRRFYSESEVIEFMAVIGSLLLQPLQQSSPDEIHPVRRPEDLAEASVQLVTA